MSTNPFSKPRRLMKISKIKIWFLLASPLILFMNVNVTAVQGGKSARSGDTWTLELMNIFKENRYLLKLFFIFMLLKKITSKSSLNKIDKFDKLAFLILV